MEAPGYSGSSVVVVGGGKESGRPHGGGRSEGRPSNIGLVCREDRKSKHHELRLNLINLGDRKTLVIWILSIASSRHSI